MGWGRFKPPAGWPLNTGHPLAPDLAWLLNEGSGVPHALGGQKLSGTLSSGNAWRTQEGGHGISADGGGNSSTYGVSLGPIDWLLGGATEATVLVWAYPDSGASWVQEDCMFTTRHSSAGTVVRMRLDHSTGYALVVITEDGTGSVNTSGPTTARLQQFGLRLSGGTLHAIYEGLLKGSVARSGAIKSATDGAWILGDPQASSDSFDGAVLCVYAYGRALTAEEIAEVHAHPYCMIHDPESLYGLTTLYSGGTPPAGISIPVVMHHRKMMGVS